MITILGEKGTEVVLRMGVGAVPSPNDRGANQHALLLLK
jgi:hypothetical protein